MVATSSVMATRAMAKPLTSTTRAPLARPTNAVAAFPKHRGLLARESRSRRLHLTRAGKIQEVTEQELEVEVANRDRPLIIDFFATWCGPCVLLAKELEAVAEELGDAVKIIKIDCDKNEAISSALQIQGLPTLIFVGMDATKPALRTEGLLPAQAIVDIVRQELLAEAS